ncbi:hypothetical protein A6P39_009840 [Streptomyces sp. FXJ1.172]|uniref:hypothetical protein n=1 Tax=Streptomyces sp. FXJ1.172 TaxID=710705 RepID=UPI000ABE81F7|nr:hypothetical protein [Streptomyces sp. FXJ1.172]WEO94292.1 hypothetical protein A6P39_009840 [Streptomyces sp. FXJ1.172]
MNLGDLTGSTLSTLTRRFFLVSYLPIGGATLALLTLAWAGAPASTLDFRRAWRTMSHLSTAQVAVIAVTVLFGAFLAHPLQLRVVRILEGHWPAALSPVAGLLRRRQAARRQRLCDAEALPEAPTDEDVARAGRAGTRRRRLYPLAPALYPTALGNVMGATEEHAGAGYGWDAVVAWPRLYPLIPEQTRQVLDDRRNTVDTAALTAALSTITAVGAAVLLCRSGWALMLVLAPLSVARLAYLGAVAGAVAYGEAVHAAFDLHRFELFTAMHLPLPANRAEERQAAAGLCDFWRQGFPVELSYCHPPKTPEPPHPTAPGPRSAEPAGTRTGPAAPTGS